MVIVIQMIKTFSTLCDTHSLVAISTYYWTLFRTKWNHFTSLPSMAWPSCISLEASIVPVHFSCFIPLRNVKTHWFALWSIHSQICNSHKTVIVKVKLRLIMNAVQHLCVVKQCMLWDKKVFQCWWLKERKRILQWCKVKKWSTVQADIRILSYYWQLTAPNHKRNKISLPSMPVFPN
jgi:hypothetical protein